MTPPVPAALLAASGDRLIEHGGSHLSSHMFQEVSSFDPRANRVTRSFDMDRDGFSLLAMGFTEVDTGGT